MQSCGEERGDGMSKSTWEDLYKRFTREYQKIKAADYRPYVEGFLPTGRPGIIIWLKNGDVLAYIPKHIEPEKE